MQCVCLNLSSAVMTGLQYPSSVAELKVIAGILHCYTSTHQFYVLLLFCCAYIYKQTFAIPGSVFLVSFITKCHMAASNSVTFHLSKCLETLNLAPQIRRVSRRQYFALYKFTYLLTYLLTWISTQTSLQIYVNITTSIVLILAVLILWQIFST